MFKKAIASVALSGGLLMGAGAIAGPASSAPVITGGLVNITVTDVLTDNQVNVQVPIGVAANVCGINANVLATQAISQPVNCTASTTQDLPVRFRR
jgi:hypothetical protein